MEYLWLIAGFVLLIVGADIFVEGSSAIAKLFKIGFGFTGEAHDKRGADYDVGNFTT